MAPKVIGGQVADGLDDPRQDGVVRREADAKLPLQGQHVDANQAFEQLDAVLDDPIGLGLSGWGTLRDRPSPNRAMTASRSASTETSPSHFRMQGGRMPMARMPRSTRSAEAWSPTPLEGTTQACMARLGSALRTTILARTSESDLRRNA